MAISNEELLAKLKELDLLKMGAELEKLTKAQLEYLERASGTTAELAEYAEAERLSLERKLENAQQRAEILEQDLKNATGALAKAEAQEAVDEHLLELAELTLRAGEDLTEEQEKRLKLLKKIKKEETDIVKIMKQQFDASSKVTETFSLGAEYAHHSFLNMEKLGRVMKGLAKGKGTGLLMAPLGLLQGLTKNLLSSFVGLAFELDKTQSAFRRATGTSEAFAGGLNRVYHEVRDTGAGLREVSTSYETLFRVVTDFTYASDTQRDSLAKTTAMLTQFGIKASDTAKGIQLSTKAFGLSNAAAKQNALDLNAVARQIGLAPEQVAADFASMGSELAKLGPNAISSFKQMEVVFKKTGFEMRKLLTLTEKFDTFEGAAEMAGNLNAALGGNFVNAMDMMMETDPVARFDSLRDSLLDAGLTFDSMSYYQRKFYAQSMGLDSVADLAMMMSGEYDMLDENINKTTGDYKKQAEMAKEMQDVTTKLKLALIQLVKAGEPVVKFLGNMIDKFTWLIEKGGQPLAWIGGGILVLKGFTTGWGLLKKTVSPLTAIWKKMTGSAKKTFDIVEEGNGVLEEFIETTEETGSGTLKFAGAVLLMGVGVAAAALGMAELVKAFGEAGDNAAAAAVGILFFGATMVGLIFMMSKLAPLAAVGGAGVAALAIPILAIGAATAIAAYGLSILVRSFKDLESIDWKTLPAFLTGTGLALFVVAAAVKKFGNPMTVAGVAAIGVLAGGLGMLIGSFRKDRTNYQEMGNAMEKISKPKPENLERIKTALGGIRKEVNDMSLMKLSALGGMLTAASANPLVGALMAGAMNVGGTNPAPAAGSSTTAGGGKAAAAGGTVYHVTVPIDVGGERIQELIISLANEQIETKLNDVGSNALTGYPQSFPTN